MAHKIKKVNKRTVPATRERALHLKEEGQDGSKHFQHLLDHLEHMSKVRVARMTAPFSLTIK